MAGKYQIQRKADRNGSCTYHFTLNARNGEEILKSPDYSSKTDAKQGIDNAQTFGADEDKFRKLKGEDEKPYFILNTDQGEEIGRSQFYSSNRSMENGISSVIKNAKTEHVEDLVNSGSPCKHRPFKRKKYEFEKKRFPLFGVLGRRDAENSEADIIALKQNLNIHDNSPLETELATIVMHLHKRVEWYQVKRNRRIIARWGFTLLTIFLLALIPVAVFFITTQATDKDLEFLTAKIAAILTGIIGVHRSLQTYLEGRNLAAIFHKASSSLKTLIFNFEEEWLGQSKQMDIVQGAYQGAVQEMIRKARKIESDEKDQYFEIKTTLPAIDLGNVILNAGQAASGIVGRHGRKLTKEVQERLLYEAKVEDLSTRVRLLEQQVRFDEANLLVTQDPEQRSFIEEQLKRSRKLLQHGKDALLTAEVKLFE